MLRRIDGLLATLILVALAIGVVSVQREAERVEGLPRVVDGDSLEIAGRRIRLAGVDAPELAQSCERPGGGTYRCGEAAREGLRALARGGLTCTLTGRDKYGRDLAVCEAAGRDVGAALVSQGLAVSYGRYEPEEREARGRGAGLWAGRFERPSAWRAAHGR